MRRDPGIRQAVPDPDCPVPDSPEHREAVAECTGAARRSPRDWGGDEFGDSPGWRVGDETDPITDETSVILWRRAEGPHLDAEAALVLPGLAITCYRALEVLLSLEAYEPVAEGDGSGGTETCVTYRIGSDPSAERTWASSAPDYSDAYLGVRGGALILARALAEEGPGEVVFRYRVVPGAEVRTVRFGLEGLAGCCQGSKGPAERAGKRATRRGIAVRQGR